MTLRCPTAISVMSDGFDAAERAGKRSTGWRVVMFLVKRGKHKYLPLSRPRTHSEVKKTTENKSWSLLFLQRGHSTVSSCTVTKRYILHALLSHEHQRNSADRDTDPTDPIPGNSHVEKPTNQDHKGQQRHQAQPTLPRTPQQRILDVRQPRHGPGLSARSSRRA